MIEETAKPENDAPEKQVAPNNDLLSGLFDKPRYDHLCRACGDEFSNIVKDCYLCCVCEVREIRSEWDS